MKLYETLGDAYAAATKTAFELLGSSKVTATFEGGDGGTATFTAGEQEIVFDVDGPPWGYDAPHYTIKDITWNR